MLDDVTIFTSSEYVNIFIVIRIGCSTGLLTVAFVCVSE